MITKPIFADDSEHLKHYGVKGMKWHQHLFKSDAQTAEEIRTAMQEGKNNARFVAKNGKHFQKGRLLYNVNWTIDQASQSYKKATNRGKAAVDRILNLHKEAKAAAKMAKNKTISTNPFYREPGIISKTHDAVSYVNKKSKRY